MVSKLFHEDPYQKECSAKVTKIDGKKVFLDQCPAGALLK